MQVCQHISTRPRPSHRGDKTNRFLESLKSSVSQCLTSPTLRLIHGALKFSAPTRPFFSSTRTNSLSAWSLSSRARRRSTMSFSFGSGVLDWFAPILRLALMTGLEREMERTTKREYQKGERGGWVGLGLGEFEVAIRNGGVGARLRPSSLSAVSRQRHQGGGAFEPADDDELEIWASM